MLPFADDDVDPYDVYQPDHPGGELLRVNMIASVDGRVTDRSGRTGGLAGCGDREVFRCLRALADGILVGAGTARIEGYGPHRVAPRLAVRRRADGRYGPAPIVVVSRSLDLDLSSALFGEAESTTIVLTCAAAPRASMEKLRAVADVVVTGGEEVDLSDGIARLRADFGLHHLLCEGGPTLNTALLGAGLVDELCLTVAPLLAGGPGPGIVHGDIPVDGLVVRTVCEQDGELYLRYVLRR